ncbi:hypothetical protein [Leptospira noguchii]|uniref:hypothetical protein n=1 Tax=Leptospira noguchii TaxID=28182 RepID=UPI001FB58B71|nr:hypothetical protein [Leptospira noguchii]UOG54675.1 hypothetical protein MAL09_20785 [Leptospira noguchii]
MALEVTKASRFYWRSSKLSVSLPMGRSSKLSVSLPMGRSSKLKRLTPYGSFE